MKLCCLVGWLDWLWTEGESEATKGEMRAGRRPSARLAPPTLRSRQRAHPAGPPTAQAMHQDDELDFGEDDLVLQPAPARSASSLDLVRPGSSASTSATLKAAGTAPPATMASLSTANLGATTATAADAVAASSLAAHHLAPASAAPSAASTPPVQPKKAHDESLDALGNKLPHGWVSRVSKSTGNVYYRNTVLNTSAWDVPTEPAAPPPAPVVAPVVAVEVAPTEQVAVAVPAPPAPVLAPEQAPAPVALEPVAQQEQQQHDTQMQMQMQDAHSQDPSAPVAPKPRVFVHPDRLKFADPEAAASSTSASFSLFPFELFKGTLILTHAPPSQPRSRRRPAPLRLAAATRCTRPVVPRRRLRVSLFFHGGVAQSHSARVRSSRRPPSAFVGLEGYPPAPGADASGTVARRAAETCAQRPPLAERRAHGARRGRRALRAREERAARVGAVEPSTSTSPSRRPLTRASPSLSSPTSPRSRRRIHLGLFAGAADRPSRLARTA